MKAALPSTFGIELQDKPCSQQQEQQERIGSRGSCCSSMFRRPAARATHHTAGTHPPRDGGAAQMLNEALVGPGDGPGGDEEAPPPPAPAGQQPDTAARPRDAAPPGLHQHGGEAAPAAGGAGRGAPRSPSPQAQAAWARVNQAVQGVRAFADGTRAMPHSHLPGSVQGINADDEHWSFLAAHFNAACNICCVDFSPEEVQVRVTCANEWGRPAAPLLLCVVAWAPMPTCAQMKGELSNDTLPAFLQEPRPAWSRWARAGGGTVAMQGGRLIVTLLLPLLLLDGRRARWINVDGISW